MIAYLNIHPLAGYCFQLTSLGTLVNTFCPSLPTITSSHLSRQLQVALPLHVWCNLITPYPTLLCLISDSHASPCLTPPCFASSLNLMPHLALPHLALPHLTFSCLILPYPTLFCLISHSHASSCLTPPCSASSHILMPHLALHHLVLPHLRFPCLILRHLTFV